MRPTFTFILNGMAKYQKEKITLLKRTGAEMRWLVFLGSLVFLLPACDRNERIVPAQPGPAYFPLQTGRWLEYQVDSTSITFNQESRFSFQERHVITDSFKNVTGSYTFVIARYRRANELMPWKPVVNWQARTSEREAVVVQGNTAFVRMIFPAQPGVQWNGNLFNNLKGKENCGDNVNFSCDQFAVEAEGVPFSNTQGKQFEEVLLVVEHDEPDLITIHDVRKVHYAKGVGMVEREDVFLEYCSNGPCLGRQFINKGWRVRVSLVDHGTQ
jgi:hypothetical protein